MSISSILNIAKGAMSATQTSIQVTSNNIANVSTTGYAREEAVLAEATPVPTSVGMMGDGVSVKQIIRIFDRYLESSIRGKKSDVQEQTTLATYLDRIQTFLDEDNSNLSSNITAFFNDWESLSSDTQNTGIKQTLVSQGETTAQTISTLYSDLKSLQNELNEQTVSQVDTVNTLLQGIADINKQIIESGGDVNSTNAYQDQKTALLNELSEKIDIQAFDDEYGRTTVLTAGGKPMVETGTVWKLATVPDATTGYSNVAWTDASGNVTDISSDLGSGELKALKEMRDTYAVDFIGDLDALAQGLINNVKWTSTSGGVTSTTSFFTGTGAANIKVSTALKDDPTLISATSDPDNNPTDNDIALRMASLADMKLVGTQQLVHTSGANALSDTYTSATDAMTDLVGGSNAWSGTVQIKGTDGVSVNVSIDLGTDTLTSIRDKINAAGATGVTASLATNTVNGVTYYQLQLTNVDATDLTDQNNVLQAMGIVTKSASLTDYASATVTKAGQYAQDAQNAQAYNEDTLSVLTTQRESVSGVSIDEEMANLIKYQYAYQAAAKLFNVADELFQSLLAVKS